MKIRTLCLLGGAGFVGKHLAYALLERGYQLRVLTRRRERHRDLLVLPALNLIEADIHDPHVLAEQFSRCDAVINLVGILNEKGNDGSGFRATHVELPRKIVEACKQARVPRLLHMSALGANADKGGSHYLRSKGAGEDLAHAVAGIAVTSFRPSVIFGPGDSFFNRFATLLKFSPGVFPLACPDSRFAPVYVEDVADAFVHALEDTASFGQRYDLCGPKIYTLRQLVEYTATVIEVKRRIIGLSDTLSRLQAKMLQYAPGKPFSLDNYHSLQTDSVCTTEFPPQFSITPHLIETIVPAYLNPKARHSPFADMRRLAGRD